MTQVGVLTITDPDSPRGTPKGNVTPAGLGKDKRGTFLISYLAFPAPDSREGNIQVAKRFYYVVAVQFGRQMRERFGNSVLSIFPTLRQ
ncbi:hypothetical protein NBRC116589_33720 [Ruegeria sp. HU-ET01832]